MDIDKLTGNEIPRPKLGKNSRYNRLVRFVDLNYAVDQIIKESTSLNSIEDLKNIKVEGRDYGSYFNVLGYHTPNDLGGDLFFWDPESEEDPDGGLIIESNSQDTGRWYRLRKEYVTPEMFGAIGDGEEDDTEAFRLAINSGVSRITSSSENIYRITDRVALRSNLKIDGCEFYQPSDAVDRIMFEGVGTTVDQVMPTDIAENSFEIEVSDPSDFSENTLINLSTTELWSQSQSVTYGEMVLAKSVSGNTVTLKSSTLLPYTSSESGTIRAVTPVENVVFENCKATTDKEGNTIFVRLEYARNFKAKDCTTYGFDYGHYYLNKTYDSYFTECQLNKTGDTIDGSNYGIVIGNSCFNANVLNCYGDGFRHFVTVGSSDGVNRFVTVDKCTITNSIDAGLDSHAASDSLKFTNNNIYISNYSLSGVRDGIITQGGSAVIKGNNIYEPRSHGVSYFNLVTPNLKKSLVIDISENKIIFSQPLEQKVLGLENAAIDIWVDRSGLTMAEVSSLHIDRNTVEVSEPTTVLKYYVRVKSEDHLIESVSITENKLVNGYSEKGIYLETVNHKIRDVQISGNIVPKVTLLNDIGNSQDLNTYTGGSVVDFTIADSASGGYLDSSYQTITKDNVGILFETFVATSDRITVRYLFRNVTGIWGATLYNETTASTIANVRIDSLYNIIVFDVGNNQVFDTGENDWHELLLSIDSGVSPGDTIRWYAAPGTSMNVGDSVEISEIRVFEDYNSDLTTTVHDCISLQGTASLPIDNVVISGNILKGSNYGLSLDYVDNVSLLGNRYKDNIAGERLISNTTNLLNYDV